MIGRIAGMVTDCEDTILVEGREDVIIISVRGISTTLTQDEAMQLSAQLENACSVTL